MKPDTCSDTSDSTASDPAPPSVARPRVDAGPRPAGTPIVELTAVLPDGSRKILRARPRSDVLTIGREFPSEKPHLVAIKHPQISQTHASLRVGSDGSLSIYDAGSTNGTFLAGSRVGPDWRPLGADGIFLVADVRVSARVVGYDDAFSSNPSTGSARSAASRGSVTSFHGTEPCPIELRTAVIQFIVVVPEGTEYVRRARAYAGFVYIGRDRDGEGAHWVSIPHSGVSRQHATLDVDENGNMNVRDVGSRNGTYVDGVRIQRSVRLGPDGVFYVGGVQVIARFDGFEELPPPRQLAPAPSGEVEAAPSTKAPSRPSWFDRVRGKPPQGG